ncbi:TRAP transporter small permease [Peptoniphilus catoniae]|uniref:TRAP transporter small permease n=1 Tax=Peptoniphilus catoniae TaxID=1660341 RepID=UPI0010FEF31D|nr:TRAP transporter small permease [Peptoniphilus catoniae]
MRKLLEKYNDIEEKILIASLAFNVLLVFFQIVMRSIFNASISWSEELSRYIFIWQIWMGVSIAFRYDQHIKVDLIYNVFKSEKAHRVIRLIVDLIWLAFNLFLVVEGFKLLQSMNARNALSSGMRIPLIHVYAALAVSSLILSIRLLINIYDQIFYKKEKTNEGLKGDYKLNLDDNKDIKESAK